MDETGGLAPVFLICSERSGSNLMASIMGAHPDIYAHPPYHLGRDMLMNLHKTMAGGTGSPLWATLGTHVVAKVRQYGEQGEAECLETWLANQTQIDPIEIARYLWTQMPEKAAGKRAFVKENNIHHMLAFLIVAFPEAKFVYQARDPRDFLASGLARRKGPLGNKFGSVREALAIWHEDQLGGLNALALLGPERVHLLRYEDLISSPESELRGICSFLDLAFDPGMLNFHQSDEAAKLAAAGGPRENVAKPLMAGNSRKYLKALSRSQIRTVEAYCGDLMRILGYNPEYGPGLMRSPWRAFWPMFCEPFERLRNRQIKPHYKVGHNRLTRAINTELQPIRPWAYEGDDHG